MTRGTSSRDTLRSPRPATSCSTSTSSSPADPTQVVNLPGVAKITINEQVTAPGSITVSALHGRLAPKDGLLGSLLNAILAG